MTGEAVSSYAALLGVFTKPPRVESLGENTKRGGDKLTYNPFGIPMV